MSDKVEVKLGVYFTNLKDALADGVEGEAWNTDLDNSSTEVPSKFAAFCALAGFPNWNLLPDDAAKKNIFKNF